MLLFLIKGMKQYIVKPVNYENIKVIQEWEENSALFQQWLVEAFRKFTNIHLSSAEGQMLLGQHFISLLLISGESCKNFNMARRPQ